MIVNEAFIALKEDVSTKNEIDTAMKLGTNYPYGPFEWCEKIGREKIRSLLQQLSKGHETFFREFGLSEKDVAAVPLAPTNLAYTSYLLAVAYGAPFHEALAALLPCYWIYWEVGKELERTGSRDPLFSRWIGTYASEEFGSVVRAVLAATDLTAASVTDEGRAAMRRHFVTTSRYEWLFWDMGFRMERWPV